MPQIKRNATLPTAAMPEPNTSFSFNEETNELTVTATFSFDYPDEAVINRYGRAPKDENGDPTGEPKPVTQVTYGRGKRIFTGSADGSDNPMFLDIKLYAPTKEAEAEEAATEED